MKKKLLTTLSLAFVAGIALSACTPEEGGGSGTYISVSPRTDLGVQLQYLPDKGSIKQRSGTIDVNLDFEGRHVGWQAVAEEYERLQSNSVKVNINWRLSGSEYTTQLQTQLKTAAKGQAEWDIVEGNLGYQNTRLACVETHSMVSQPNPYCGKTNQKWSDVLYRRAYYNYDSDTKVGDHYILNSEDMQSCWFVNKVAMRAAYTQGYRNSDGVDDGVEYPITWDDLISLCTYMEGAGYTNPLGISLADASIKSLQFTWLLRIYGDYYYRQFYKYIMSGASSTTWSSWDDATSPSIGDIETYSGFGTMNCKVLNLLFDKTTTFGPGYVGFESEVYQDFVKNLAKMKGHLIKDVASTEFSSVRTQFMNQNNKSAAQIILDYSGQGLQYMSKENPGVFELGWFDYPQMKSGTFEEETTKHEAGTKIVSDNTITRDIGGNGGFISVVQHKTNTEQTELSKDFIRFFLSPYGQTIYYKGLAESSDNMTPKGLTTVDNDLVVIPEQWKTFFSESTSPLDTNEQAKPVNSYIKFNGNVDPNTFLSYGVRYFNGYDQSEANICALWRKLLTTNELSVINFSAQWGNYCFEDYKSMCADGDHQWPTSLYQNPDQGY